MLGCRLLPEWYFSAGTHVVKHRHVNMERIKHDLTQIPEPIHHKQPAIFVYDCPSNKKQGGETSKKKSNRPIDTFRPTNLGFCDSSMRMEKKFLSNILSNKWWDLMVKKH